jgi:hypothetical protein
MKLYFLMPPNDYDILLAEFNPLLESIFLIFGEEP